MLNTTQIRFYYTRVVTKKVHRHGTWVMGCWAEQHHHLQCRNVGCMQWHVSREWSCSWNNCNNRTNRPCWLPHHMSSVNASIVISCTEFVAGVCSGNEENGNHLVNILFQPHGESGNYCFAPLQTKPFDFIYKESPCYESICDNLRVKIKALTILAHSVAGPELIQCLAKCLNAEVKAYCTCIYKTDL